MTKDEIIVLLKEQLQLANEQLQQANATVSSLTLQVGELIERIKSLEESLVQKGIAIDKANRQNKALARLRQKSYDGSFSFLYTEKLFQSSCYSNYRPKGT